MAQPAPAEQPTLAAQPAPTDEQPTFMAQPAPAKQPTLMVQPASVAQFAPVAFQVTQIGPRLVQPSRLQISKPMIKPGAFAPHFSTDLTFPNSNLPHFHYSRRNIPSKLSQLEWKTTLVLRSYKVDERSRTADDLGEPDLTT
ncbi:hypothetical protein PS1_044030 [Malus domestica]